ncbi:MAG: hypothetical protein ACFFGZ_08540 [Candidatus Thorarchaeota archaeon]
MSDREREQKEKKTQITEKERERKILESILFYYEKKQEVKQFLGEDVSIRDFKRYLLDQDYPQLLDAEMEVIQAKVAKRQAEMEGLRAVKTEKPRDFAPAAKTAKSTTLGSLSSLLFIPSWGKLLETDFRGFYLNEPVYEIVRDTIVLLPNIALSGHEKTLGEPFFLILGPGVYYTAFRLSPGKIITDHREITGILLPLAIYEKAQDLSGSVISTTAENLRMTEYLTSIPFSLIEAKQTTQMFLRGVIARNVIHPNREAYDLLVKICKDKNSFNIEEGFKILSGGLSTKIPLYTNEILTEKSIQRNNYSNLTAGIKNIQPKVKKIITDLQIGPMKADLFEKMNRIKKDFIKIGHPRLTDWMV